jgi:16S rRNA (cytosine1402-N4)-methyltransferase
MSDPEDGERQVHSPVLPAEVERLLAPMPGDTVVDCTLGMGGHAERLLEAVHPGGRLIGFDRDPEAIRAASRRLERFGGAFTPVHADYRDLRAQLARLGTGPVDRILADLGVSSAQMLDPRRGFSFSSDAPLDMRMDPHTGETAADLLARLDERALAALLTENGEEPEARAIARAIVRARESAPVRTTKQLASLVERSARFRRDRRIHPATRTFMALRIAVNDELRGLETFVEDAMDALRPGGRLAVITFHSLEDRPVKTALRRLAAGCTCPPELPVCGCGKSPRARLLVARAVRPGEAELAANPRSSSARLRAAERVASSGPDPS